MASAAKCASWSDMLPPLGCLPSESRSLYTTRAVRVSSTLIELELCQLQTRTAGQGALPGTSQGTGNIHLRSAEAEAEAEALGFRHIFCSRLKQFRSIAELGSQVHPVASLLLRFVIERMCHSAC
jgi:hypothetical protein